MNEMIESMKALEVDELSSAGILHAGEDVSPIGFQGLPLPAVSRLTTYPLGHYQAQWE